MEPATVVTMGLGDVKLEEPTGAELKVDPRPNRMKSYKVEQGREICLTNECKVETGTIIHSGVVGVGGLSVVLAVHQSLANFVATAVFSRVSEARSTTESSDQNRDRFVFSRV